MPKNRLNVVDNVVPNTTCFAEHEKHGVSCRRRRCRNWVPMKEHHNCTLIAASHGRFTLERLAAMYGVSRMQVCKVESQILKKIRSSI